MAKEANYSDELVAKIVMDYDGGEGKSVEEIAEETGKSVNSIRSKLVHQGVYKPVPKQKQAKRQGPSKKQILANLSEFVGDNTANGLAGARKDALESLLSQLTNPVIDED